MLRSYFTTAWRTLARHRLFSTITILGLAFSMAICLLLLTFVWDQKQYDAFHSKADDIYRILSYQRLQSGDVNALAATPAPLAELLEREVDGISSTLRLGQIRAGAFHDGIMVRVEGLYAEPSFFDMFDFEVEAGDGPAMLAAPNQLILSREAAERVFGVRDPVGETVTLEGHGDFVVAGLLRRDERKSHLKFDLLASFSSIITSTRSDELSDWNNSWRFATYVLLEDEGVLNRLDDLLPGVSARQYAGQESTLEFRVQPLRDIALGPVLSNEISSYSVPAFIAYFLAALGLIIMLAACFNYVTLSVARAMRRTREVGVRKSVGAGRHHVVMQFLAEGVLVALIAVVGAYLLLLWLLPAFNGLTFIQMGRFEVPLSRLYDPALLALFVVSSVAVGALAGLYPALRLSSVRPVAVLKGNVSIRGFTGSRLRHSLTGIQIGLALFFVTTTTLLYAQFRHVVQADYGFDKQNILNVDLQGQSYELLRAELMRSPAIESVSATSKIPASGSTSRVALGAPGMDGPLGVFEYSVDPAFVDNLGLRIIAGRDFSVEMATDAAGAVLVNETAVRRLGYETPSDAIGAVFSLGDEERPVEVIGVVEDYHYNTTLDPIHGLVLHFSPEAFRYANVRVHPGSMADAEAHLERVWSGIDPVRPIVYERFDVQLEDNILMQVFGDFTGLIGLVALLALVISCLGLFGMAVYSVETRRKEVGLRKVMGASPSQVVLLLTRGFLWLMVASAAIAVPITWITSSLWLQIFASRIALTPWWFAGCAAAVATLALLVIGSQTASAANVDPAETLRYE